MNTVQDRNYNTHIIIIQYVLTYIVTTGDAQQETQEHYVAENVGEYMVKKRPHS